MPARPTPEQLDRLGTVYPDRKGEWRWRIRAKNGRKVANGGEGYASQAWCIAMCLSCGITEENLTIIPKPKPRKKKKT